MYQVLARKWRPKGFDELVGQRHVAQTIGNSVASGRMAHAYLFAGLRGTGKTTVARILAKCLNCEKGPTTEPCHECVACREIAESRAIDVLEIDAASRTKVEQTRELLEMVSYAPARDRNKILIIDEAHMLSKASFNALLKTLEEPPPNVVFILATTEIQKVLPTILSRCQVFEFRRVPAREVAAHLRTLCDAESIRVSDGSLDRIARAGEGSVRDSLSVLERVLAFCGTEVDDDEVLRVLGAVRSEVLIGTLRGLAERDAGAMLEVLDALVDEGHDLLHFWGELVAALRDLLFRNAVPDRTELLTRPPEEAAALEEAAAGLSRQDLIRAFQLLASLEPSLKSSSHPKFMFEAALIRLAALGDVRPIEEILSELESGAPPRPRAPRPAEKKTPPRRETEPVAAAPRPAPVESRPAAPDPAPSPTVASPGGGGFLERVRDEKPMLGAMLEQCSRIAVDGDKVRVIFDPENDALARSLERKESLAVLERQAAGAHGREMRVAIEVSAEDAPPPDGPSMASDSAPRQKPRRRDPAAKSKELMEQATNEPGVKKLLREFGAQVIEVSPLETPPPIDGGVEEPK